MTIEQVYNDLREELLPLIGKGIIVSKEYLADLFGRYITYLIIHDVASIMFLILLIVVGIIAYVMLIKIISNSGAKEEKIAEFKFFYGLLLLAYIFIVMLVIVQHIDNVIKSITVPEIRIIEHIKYLNSK